MSRFRIAYRDVGLIEKGKTEPIQIPDEKVFEYVPWLEKADFSEAKVRIDLNYPPEDAKYFTMTHADWNDGIWEGGTWDDGIWYNPLERWCLEGRLLEKRYLG